MAYQTDRARQRIPKASDLLADALRRQVLGESLAEGTSLPSESELVEQWQLSRATVREALRLLETDGLIRIKRGPGGGITVARPDPSHITRSLALLLSLDQAPLRDLFAFRKLVEPAAAQLAAKRADHEQKALLAKVADVAEGAGVDRDKLPSDRVDFHMLIADASGNELLKVVHAAVQDVVRWHADEERLTPTDLEAVDRAHRSIARHILAGKGEAAAGVMLRHLDRFEQRMRELGRLDQPIIPREWWHEASSLRDARRIARTSSTK